MSRGGWVRLKYARRRGAKGSAAVLRNTGTLFAALNPKFQSDPGSLQLELHNGIRVGFGGSQKHEGGRTTISDIAAMHQFGLGNLPKREIIVSPDDKTFRSMARLVEKYWRKVGN